MTIKEKVLEKLEKEFDIPIKPTEEIRIAIDLTEKFTRKECEKIKEYVCGNCKKKVPFLLDGLCWFCNNDHYAKEGAELERQKITTLIEKEIETLAELEHEQWQSWIFYYKPEHPLINIPYSKLTEEEKEMDRIWARKVLKALLQKIKGV